MPLLKYPARVAFHPTLKRPGCVLMQSLAGASRGIAEQFPSDTWLVGGEKGFNVNDLRIYRVENDEELDALVTLATAHARNRK